MTTGQAAPDPAGARPDEFPERQWPAYQRWATGATRADAGDAAGVSNSTIGRWVKQWRGTYDTTALDTRTPGLTDEARQAGSDAAAVGRWVDSRAEWAEREQGTAETMAALVTALVQGPLQPTNPAIAGMEPSEAGLLLTRVYRVLTEAFRNADRLASIPSLSPVRVQETIDVQPGELVDPHLLDRMYGTGDNDDDILDDLDQVQEQFEAQTEAATEPEDDGE